MKKTIAVILMIVITLSAATVIVLGEKQPATASDATASSVVEVVQNEAQNEVIVVSNDENEVSLLVSNDISGEITK